jgi:hypothetical protein
MELLLDVVRDFPFQTPAHRSTWLSATLTPLARWAFDGPTPLHLFDANTRGAGKTLLADLASQIAFGRVASRMSSPKDDDECRKRITALALAGDLSVLIDNIVGAFGSAALDAALTADRWKDRILGKSEIVELALRMTWMASGNNVVLAADTPRRVIHSRLNSTLERPEERTGFKHPDVREYVRNNRPALLAAALTILRAWFVAGKPRAGISNWGSYEGYSGVVREAIVWCGQPDPADTRQELVEHSDRETSALRELIAGFDELDPDCAGIQAADICRKIEDEPHRYSLARNALSELVQKVTPRSVGNRLRHLRGRVVGGRTLDERMTRRGVKAWRVVPVGAAGSAGSEGSVASPGRVIAGREVASQQREGDTVPETTSSGPATEHAEPADPAIDSASWGEV